MENPYNFNKNYNPQSVILNNYENNNAYTQRNEEQKRLITKLTNDNTMLKFELEELRKKAEELKAYCISKDETIERYKNLSTRNLKQNSELKTEIENLKNHIYILEIDNASLKTENERFTSMIKDRNKKIEQLKEINNLNSKRFESKMLETESFYKEYIEKNDGLKKELEKSQIQLNKKINEVKYLREAFKIDEDNNQNLPNPNNNNNNNNKNNNNNINDDEDSMEKINELIAKNEMGENFNNINFYKNSSEEDSD